jgi:hypothetical protein
MKVIGVREVEIIVVVSGPGLPIGRRSGLTSSNNVVDARTGVFGCFSCALPDDAARKKPQRKPDMIQLPLPDLDENQRKPGFFMSGEN